MISLSLPEEAAFTLFRLLRTNLKTKYTPVFGLVVKTEAVAQQQAQQVGFHRDHHQADRDRRPRGQDGEGDEPRHVAPLFQLDKEFFTMRLPENCTPIVINEVTNHLKPKLAEAVNAGLSRASSMCTRSRAST